jgi:hypothetical protein
MPRLREMVLYPVVHPKSLIEEIEKSTMNAIESLNLGIININVIEYSRLFGEALLCFPKLEQLRVHVTSLSD